MSKTKPIPVRLPEDLIARLDRAADQCGTLATRASVIRYCVETWLDYFELHGRAALTMDWEKIILSFDGRRRYPESQGANYALNDKPPLNSSEIGEDGKKVVKELSKISAGKKSTSRRAAKARDQKHGDHISNNEK